jgi:uncharacterized membrane protein (DUF4010 family)
MGEMDLTLVFKQLGIALGLGLLVGLQRERVASRLAGVRTFPMITILGTVCAMLAQTFGGWVMAAGFITLAGMIIIGNIVVLKDSNTDHGLTTEIAMLLMFAVGAYLVVGHVEVAIAVGGGVAVLLQFKGELHGVTARLGETDLKAIMQFALISLVILPVLPNQTYDRFAVLNPRQIWWMVVLIVGINLGGYIAYKFFGRETGVILGGILGGLISSTATTVSYTRRTSNAPDASQLAAIVIIISSTVVFARVLLEIALIAPSFLSAAAVPILIMLLLFMMLAAGVWFWARKEQTEMPPQQNPTELKSALLFGIVYAIVIFAVAAVRERFGDSGLYIVAGLSGLTDVDAITLSTSQLVNSGRLGAETGWRLIVLALMSNLVFKAAIVVALGHRNLLAKIGPVYGLGLGAGALLLALWP